MAGEKHLSDFTQQSQLRFFLKLILIIINYGFVIQSVTLLKLAVEQPLNSWQQSLKNTIFTLGWSSYCIIYDCIKMNLLRKMVIGAANRYNQLMTYMQIFKTLNTKTQKWTNNGFRNTKKHPKNEYIRKVINLVKQMVFNIVHWF